MCTHTQTYKLHACKSEDHVCFDLDTYELLISLSQRADHSQYANLQTQWMPFTFTIILSETYVNGVTTATTEGLIQLFKKK